MVVTIRAEQRPVPVGERLRRLEGLLFRRALLTQAEELIARDHGIQERASNVRQPRVS